MIVGSADNRSALLLIFKYIYNKILSDFYSNTICISDIHVYQTNTSTMYITYLYFYTDMCMIPTLTWDKVHVNIFMLAATWRFQIKNRSE